MNAADEFMTAVSAGDTRPMVEFEIPDDASEATTPAVVFTWRDLSVAVVLSCIEIGEPILVLDVFSLRDGAEVSGIETLQWKVERR